MKYKLRNNRQLQIKKNKTQYNRRNISYKLTKIKNINL